MDVLSMWTEIGLTRCKSAFLQHKNGNQTRNRSCCCDLMRVDSSSSTKICGVGEGIASPAERGSDRSEVNLSKVEKREVALLHPPPPPPSSLGLLVKGCVQIGLKVFEEDGTTSLTWYDMNLSKKTTKKMMTMTEEPDFNHALSCLDDFDVDESFEALLKGHDLFVKQEGGAHNGHLQAKSSGVHGVKRHSHHRPGVAGGKRSFKDYTKPIKRGFLNRQIPANDIRRFLAQIVVHACNLHNPDHLATVLKEYCGPSVVLNTRFIGNADSHPIKNAIMYRELHGIGHITRYFDALLQAVPDGVIKLLDSKVHMFQNGCSYIVGKFVFKGQKCFDLVTVGDTKDKRAVPSKFDRRSVAAAAAAAAQARQLGQMGNSNCGSLFSPTPLGHYGSSGSAMDPFHFLSESAVMLGELSILVSRRVLV
eukprot:scaffold1829_cov194-Ochromonas_danica.AAC.22